MTVSQIGGVLAGGRYLRTLESSSGVDDTAYINEELAKGGFIRFRPGETYKLSGPMVQHSDTIVDWSACGFETLPGFGTHMWANYSALNPVATDEDAKAFAGSPVIDFFPGSGAAAKFTVGQTVVVDVAGGSQINAPVPLVARIVKVNVDPRNDGTTPTGVPNTITLDRPAKLTTDYYGIRSYNRDKNIGIIGGFLDRGTRGFTGKAINGNSMMFRHVDDFLVDLEGFNSEGNLAHYPISAADFSNGRFRVRDMHSGRDGIHLMGPFLNAHVEEISGYCADDVLSLTACDYAGGLTDSAGDCIGLTWGRLTADTHQQIVKIMAGDKCHVDKVKGGYARGTADHYPAWVGEDTGNRGTTGGSYGDIDLGVIDARSSAPGTYSQLLLANPNARSIKARLVNEQGSGFVVVTGRGGTGGATGGAGTTAVVDRLDLEVSAKGPVRLVNMASPNTTIGDLVLDGQYDQVSGANPALVLAGRVARLEARLRATLTAPFASGLQRLIGRTIGVDVATLTPADGDLALNTNADLGCGAGLVVWNAAAGKWKNLYTGATT